MHGPVSTQDDSQAELFLLLRPWAPGTGSAQGAGSARRKSVTGTQSDLVRRALQQETVLLSGSRVGLPSGPPAPASTAGSPCERKPPATWVATPPPRSVVQRRSAGGRLARHHCAGRWTLSLTLSDTQRTRQPGAPGGSSTARATR